MTPSARAAQRHLLTLWSDVRVGTRVQVRQWSHPTVTASEPWINTNGVAVIRLAAFGGIEVALDRVSLAGPPALTVADVVQALPSEPLSCVDDGRAFTGALIAFALTLMASGILQVLFRGSP